MRLGIYCDSAINGGHEEMLKRFMRALVTSVGIDTLHILVPVANEALYEYVIDLARTCPKVQVIGLEYTAESIKGDMFALMRASRSTTAVLRSLRLSRLLLAQGTIASGLAGLIAARLAGVTAVSYLPLVDDGPTRPGSVAALKWMIKRLLYRMPQEYITLNEHLSGKLQRLAPGARRMVLDNYVDDRFSRSTLSREAARETLGLPNDGRTIIAHIGRLNCQQKRQDFLLDTIERHARTFENTLVLIVGEGPDAERLKARIDSTPALRACVRMEGPQADVLPYIIASDVLVLPSAYEGVPLVMIEAVLAERPIVVSRVSGLESYLPDSLLFPAHDPDAFVERVFAARDVPMAGLSREFRRRFSREAFDIQAQATATSMASTRSGQTHAGHEPSDVLAK